MRHLGNSLILLSLSVFIYIFYPLLQIYLFPPKIVDSLPAKGTFITIPKINAQAPVLENVDPWDEVSYQKALKEGVAHAKGTSLPDQDGTVFLFAHSSGMPWELTRFNTIFLRLGELKNGDVIKITRNGEKFNYKVFDKKEVFPNEVSYLSRTRTVQDSVEEKQLILQTCTPIGTSIKRLLVFAEQV